MQTPRNNYPPAGESHSPTGIAPKKVLVAKGIAYEVTPECRPGCARPVPVVDFDYEAVDRALAGTEADTETPEDSRREDLLTVLRHLVTYCLRPTLPGAHASAPMAGLRLLALAYALDPGAFAAQGLHTQIAIAKSYGVSLGAFKMALQRLDPAALKLA